MVIMLSREFGGIRIEDPKARSIARVTREIASKNHEASAFTDEETLNELRKGQQDALTVLSTVGAHNKVPDGAIAKGIVKQASSADYEVVQREVILLQGEPGAPPNSVIAHPSVAAKGYLKQQYDVALQRERAANATSSKIGATVFESILAAESLALGHATYTFVDKRDVAVSVILGVVTVATGVGASICDNIRRKAKSRKRMFKQSNSY